jgi:hypothetical protein
LQVKYNASSGQRQLKPHRDGAPPTHLAQPRTTLRNLALELAWHTTPTAPTILTAPSGMPARPGALFSFNLALNGLEEYEGGGTYFRRLEGSGAAAALRSPKGHLLAHSSALVHGGHPISSGVR